jgi:hypothetical protein
MSHGHTTWGESGRVDGEHPKDPATPQHCNRTSGGHEQFPLVAGPARLYAEIFIEQVLSKIDEHSTFSLRFPFAVPWPKIPLKLLSISERRFHQLLVDGLQQSALKFARNWRLLHVAAPNLEWPFCWRRRSGRRWVRDHFRNFYELYRP